MSRNRVRLEIVHTYLTVYIHIIIHHKHVTSSRVAKRRDVTQKVGGSNPNVATCSWAMELHHT